ncbi:MAG: hypothetical protein AB1635_19270 [Acidobacteriota bacterium]
MRRPAFALAAVTLATAAALGFAEVALRVVYREGGRRTLGGPGGQEFEYDYVQGEDRVPQATGPKAPGITRIAVFGDSITFGMGLRDWRQTYPAQLLDRLNRDGPRYDMATWAHAGLEVHGHAWNIETFALPLEPDVVIYQWFINDLEVNKDARPLPPPSLRDHWLGGWFARRTVLGYILNARLASVQAGAAYATYLRERFSPGTAGWDVFACYFHNFATLASSTASRRLLLLYPQLPVPSPNPVQAIYDGVRGLASPHLLRLHGEHFPSSEPTGAVTTPFLFFLPGWHELSVRLRVLHDGATATATLTDREGQVHAAVRAPTGPRGEWQTVTVPFEVPNGPPRALSLAVRADERGAVVVDTITSQTDYGFELIDPTTALSGFDTHVSSFDSHPNARAHAVLADLLAAAITRGAPSR